jgi:acyl carrier protein
MKDMKNELLKILLQIRPENDFLSSDDFIEDRFLDSLDVIRLVSELDSKFNISIDGLDIVPDNFKSLDSIENLIKVNGGILE